MNKQLPKGVMALIADRGIKCSCLVIPKDVPTCYSFCCEYEGWYVPVSRAAEFAEGLKK